MQVSSVVVVEEVTREKATQLVYICLGFVCKVYDCKEDIQKRKERIFNDNYNHYYV